MTRRYHEERLQMACVRWFGLQYPEHELLLHHSPNEGVRTAANGGKLKAMGMRAGFPDLVLLLPRHGCPFLCVEMKSQKGRQTKTQREYQQAVERHGGKYVVVREFEDFVKQIKEYVNE